jgi:hypothetical protein
MNKQATVQEERMSDALQVFFVLMIAFVVIFTAGWMVGRSDGWVEGWNNREKLEDEFAHERKKMDVKRR